MVYFWILLYIAIASAVLFIGLVVSDRLFSCEPGDGLHIFSILTAVLWPALILPYAATVAAFIYLRSKEDQ